MRQGIEAEELVLVDPTFARRAISALMLMTITTHDADRPVPAAHLADDVASLVLRALLTKVSELPRVRREGAAIAEHLHEQTAANRAGQPA